MLKCKNCGQELAGGEKFCPSCGNKSERDSAENNEQNELLDGQTGGKKPGKGIIIGAIAIIAAIAIAATLYATGAFSPSGNTVVATAGSGRLTNSQLAYYYWGEYFYLENYYAQYGMSIEDLLDPTVGLADQPFVSEEWPTWNDYFIDTATENWRNTLAIYNEAMANGHVMDAERTASLQNLNDQLAAEAETYNFESIDAMLRDDYGRFASYDGYREYLEMQYTAYSYVFEVYGKLVEKYSVGLETVPSVHIRHILLSTDINGDAAKEMAESLYDEWKAVGTEEYFAQLAGENSNDPGSQGVGGLYENVSPGEMVEEFNDWCFDESRQIGDTGIVETAYGFHIMYYSGNGSLVPKNADAQSIAESYASEEYGAWIDELVNRLGVFNVLANKADVGK